MQVSEYLYVPLIVWGLTQGLKFFLAMLKGRYRPALLFSSGGMPSVHSATVAALATVAFIEGGPDSPLFGITGLFAAIVMYDSLGVRRSAGEQAKTLNTLIDDLFQAGALKSPGRYQHLKEILGHRPLEVVVGAQIGVCLAVIMLYQTVFERAPWLTTIPSQLAMGIELGLAVALVASGFASWVAARRSKSRWRQFLPFLRHIFMSNVVIALVLSGFVFMQQQAIRPLSDWSAVVVIGIIFFTWHLGLWYRLLIDGRLRDSSGRLSAGETRRQSWLKKAGRRAGRRSPKKA